MRAASGRLLAVPDRDELETRTSCDIRRGDGRGVRQNREEAVCERCFGTGMEIVPEKGARKCLCRLSDLRRRQFEQAGVPRRHEECSLSNYRPATENVSQVFAFKQAYCLVREYPAVERGLLFGGPVGVGKTHLSVAILRGLAEKGVAGLFCEYGSLLKEIQDSYNPVSRTSEMRVLTPVYDAEVLVLDELGASKPTDWVLDTMTHIIGRRYNDKKLTIFTTNYTDERQNPAGETLQDRIGARLRSRLYEMCSTVLLNGEDYRRRLSSFTQESQ
jgi:DNA replication protein DnaC